MGLDCIYSKIQKNQKGQTFQIRFILSKKNINFLGIKNLSDIVEVGISMTYDMLLRYLRKIKHLIFALNCRYQRFEFDDFISKS